MIERQVFGHQATYARPLWRSMARGFAGRCPHCGKGRVFGRFLKVADACNACGEEFHHHRADDLPAYLVIFIVGHLVVGAFMGAEAVFSLTTWQHLAIWAPATLVMAVGLLQPVKGAVVGLQWALRMHGFSGSPDTVETHPDL